MSDNLRIWRVRGLRDLELHRADGDGAAREPHLHGQFEIAVVARGAQRVRHRGATHLAAAGSVFVIPPGEVHTHSPVDGGLISRSFFPDLSSLVDASDFARAGDGSPQFRDTVIGDADLATRITALHQQLERVGPALARETNAVTAATLLVCRHAVGGRTAAYRPERDLVRRVQRYLHDRLDRNVTLAELTALGEIPAYALVRAFTRGVGMPPHSYHLQLRLDRAKQLLARGHAPARVAVDVGFVDQSHLTRHFRRWVGATPGAYAAATLP